MHVHSLHMGGCFTLHPHAATDVDSWNRPDSVHKMCFKIQNVLDIEGGLQILSKKKKNSRFRVSFDINYYCKINHQILLLAESSTLGVLSNSLTKAGEEGKGFIQFKIYPYAWIICCD